MSMIENQKEKSRKKKRLSDIFFSGKKI